MVGVETGSSFISTCGVKEEKKVEGLLRFLFPLPYTIKRTLTFMNFLGNAIKYKWQYLNLLEGTLTFNWWVRQTDRQTDRQTLRL